MLRRPAAWEAGYLAPLRNPRGPGRGSSAPHRTAPGRRGGADRPRARPGRGGVGAGDAEREAALLRGFVLGEDDRIDPATVDDFKRSGLAHLLAVSGENVMLLALLAMPLLALLGVPLRARLVLVLALIAIYVPVTGAGPSIQRAGVMGAAGVVAALAGRPRSRWYALLLAALVTLALNPRASGDPGWQLSFAAVIGILLWAARLRDVLLGGSRPPRHGARGWRRGLAEGAAVTVSATVATAPLMAHDFGAVSVASLPANLLALPAVAPLMWLGMLVGPGRPGPGVPVEPLTWLARLLTPTSPRSPTGSARPPGRGSTSRFPERRAVLASYAPLGLVLWVAARLGAAAPRPARLARQAQGPGRGSRGGDRAVAVVGPGRAPERPGGPPSGLRVTVLDVGQGDSILLDPADGEPVLVDGGPPGAELRDHLAGEGISGLAAAVVTHDQSDHAAGIEELLGSLPIHRLIYAERGAGFLGAARAAGVPATSIAEGSEVDSGSLRLEALWPPRALIDGPAREDPNQAALVLLARWHGFSMLLTADAEAEAVPIDPDRSTCSRSPITVPTTRDSSPLLDRAAPRLAVISVGEDNPYGHPTPADDVHAGGARRSHASHRRGRRRDDRRHADGWAGGGRRLSKVGVPLEASSGGQGEGGARLARAGRAAVRRPRIRLRGDDRLDGGHRPDAHLP